MENSNKELIELQQDTVKLLAILVKRDTMQSTLIHEMYNVGFAPKRIAELLNTTANTVRVVANRSKKIK